MRNPRYSIFPLYMCIYLVKMGSAPQIPVQLFFFVHFGEQSPWCLICTGFPVGTSFDINLGWVEDKHESYLPCAFQLGCMVPSLVLSDRHLRTEKSEVKVWNVCKK